MTRWTFDDIPDQTGRTAVVTGANSGIGYETARMLARKGARVVLACRSAAKGEAAVRTLRSEGAGAPGPAEGSVSVQGGVSTQGSVEFAALDLSDLDSVAAFAERFTAENDRLDLLVNNAGVMVPPFTRTEQGFELQLGTNHFGHFALTGRLLPLLERTAGSRIVTVSSAAHRIGRIDFDDLNWARRTYKPMAAYGQSKLANLMFTLELRRRLTAAGSAVRATAAHPGFTTTNLGRTAGAPVHFLERLVGMASHDGALPTLLAATDPAAESGSYWGPAHLFESRGAPVRARVSRRARDEAVAGRLWEESEKATGVTFAFTSNGGDSGGTGV
ncbi:oxidoreductase [Streptomyces paludis]|uniref:SDR family NAD(P)-dependent oxidoreductase n=1 Tax=Streptomyces paludis TaxID=2282738 RepID=A0A345HRE3_9ACTN|nr:oxidoreductase [Streptomyces paludis]AXG79267.1 SDR family NAD(P)-dependent oxidoreductase [Streptomyces paludis]